MDTLEKVLPRTIFLTTSGSHLYGTNVTGSDYDFKGVCIPTEDYFFGWMKAFEQLERHASKGHPADLTVMSLSKFCKLAVDCNPNIIEILFAPDESIIHIDAFGEELREHRYDFLSKKARYTFAGYAHAQLKRIKTHRKWLLDPPTQRPERSDFGLSNEVRAVTKAELGAFQAIEHDEALPIEMAPQVVTMFLRERQYQAAVTHWKQYENWKATRNEARADLEAQHGYDTKHAMHLVRLMRMCREILRDGNVVVRRPDAEELLAIRRGEWLYDEVIETADALEAECAELYTTSSLRKEPDRVALNEIVVEMTKRYLKRCAP